MGIRVGWGWNFIKADISGHLRSFYYCGGVELWMGNVPRGIFPAAASDEVQEPTAEPCQVRISKYYGKR